MLSVDGNMVKRIPLMVIRNRHAKHPLQALPLDWPNRKNHFRVRGDVSGFCGVLGVCY